MKWLKSVQQREEVKNSWCKEGTVQALLQKEKIVKVTDRRELKVIDEAASGSAPVLKIELSEVLAPPDKAERRTG